MSKIKRFAGIVENLEILYGGWRSRLLWIMFLMGMSCCFAATTSQKDLLNFLVNQNEAAWEKIHSLKTIQYTHETEWLARGQQSPFKGVAQIKKKGDWSWSRYQRDLVDGRTSQAGVQDIRQVVNDTYIGQWPGFNNPFAYIWDHASVDALSPRQQDRIRTATPYDFLPVCFGTESARFREAMARWADDVKYNAAELRGEDGRPLYQITRSFPQDTTPNLVWMIDPQRGFLATECTFYPGGHLLMRQIMQVEEISPGIWYPVGYEETRFSELKAGESTPSVRSWVKSEIRDIKINEPLPDEQFQFDALGLRKDKPDIVVVRTGLDGEKNMYTYQNGQLVLTH